MEEEPIASAASGPPPSHETDSLEEDLRPFRFSCLNKWFLYKTNDATGTGLIKMACGQVTMSNTFLSTAFLTLAQMEIGCYDDNIECGKVYGYKPSSLITLIGTVSGLLSAFFLPFIGAMIDCTRHRKLIGIISSFLLMLVQFVQIETTQSTWFFMSILQALNGFIFQVVTLASFAYLPEIGRVVGEDTMNKYFAEWAVARIIFQLVYMVIVIGSSIGFSLDDIRTAQLSQALNVVLSGLCFYYGWKYMQEKEAKNELSNNESIFSVGFVQVFQTAKTIWRHYGCSLGWFLLAVTFGDAACNSFVLVAVTYLKEVMHFSSSEVGIMFLITVIFTIPGSYVGKLLTERYSCPKTSMKIQIAAFVVINSAGFHFLEDPSRVKLTFCFGALWGILLGWYFQTESLIFSMIVPKGNETEIAGFFLYCTQVLGWLPPLVFTEMNEYGIPLKWGGIHLNIYLVIALICYFCMAPWSHCLDLVQWNRMDDGIALGENIISQKSSEHEERMHIS